MRRRRRPLLVLAAASILLLFVIPQIVIRTDWFRSWLESRITAEIEAATGGVAAMEGSTFDALAMSLAVTGLQVRAREGDSEPFLRVAELEVGLTLHSFLRRGVSLRGLRLRSPEIRIDIFEDGSTNLPAPGQGPTAEGPVADFLDLAVDRFEIDAGQLIWNGQAYRLSYRADGFELATVYERDDERYRASLRLGESSLEIEGREPFVSYGSAEVFIYRNRIDAQEVSLVAQDSAIEAAVQVSDLQEPRLKAQYRIRGEIQPWTKWLGWSQDLAGRFDVKGEADWDQPQGALAYHGSLRVERILYRSGDIELHAGPAAAEFRGDGDEAALSEIRLAALGANFEGAGSLTEFRPGGPALALNGEFAGLSLGTLAESVLHPSRELLWQSLVAGKVELWRGVGGGLQVDLDLSLAADPDSAPEQIPMEGTLTARYSPEEFALVDSEIDLRTPSGEVRLQGRLSLEGRSQLSGRIGTGSERELTELMVLAGLDRDELPIRIESEILFTGSVDGVLTEQGGYRVSGNLATGRLQMLQQRWTSFRGDIDLGSSDFQIRSGRLLAGEGVVDVELTAPLHSGALDLGRPVALDVKLAGIEVSRILLAADLDFPLSGLIKARIAANGPVAGLQGEADVEISGGKLFGEPFQQLSGRLGFVEDRYTLDALALELRRARIDATGEFLPGTQRFRLELVGSDWRLQDLDAFRGANRQPSGDIRFDLTASGALQLGVEPIRDLELSGTWSVDGFSIDSQALGQVAGELTSDGRQVELDWRADLLDGIASGTGTLQPSSVGAFAGGLEFKDFDIEKMAALLGMPLARGVGAADGHCTFEGTLADIGTLAAQGEITRLELGLAEIPGSERGYDLWNPFPMRWNYAERTLHLDHMRLLGEGTDIELNGKVPFSPGGETDVEVDGTFNLTVIESFRPELGASGSSELHVRIGGSLENPKIKGRMQLSQASLRSTDFPNGLSDLNGRLSFTGDQMTIEEVTATSGGGKLRLTGTAEFSAKPVTYRMRVDINRVRLRYPPAVSSTFDGRVAFSGSGTQSLLTGEIVVRRAVISPKFDVGAVLATLGEPTQTPESSPMLLNMQLNLHIGSLPDLRLENPSIEDMETKIDLRLTGTAASPSFLGSLAVTRGTLHFQGSRFVINRGDIDFINPFRPEPVVNFELETRIRDVDIALTLAGPARRPNISYRSDPPLQFNDLINLIAVGRTPVLDPVFAAQQSIQQQALIQSGPSNIFSQAVSQRQSPGLQRFFGVSRLKVDPEVGGVESNPSARISTEQQITSDLTLTYSYDLSSAQQQVVRVEWAPDRQWSFIVTRDENGLVGADILYKTRLR